MGKLGLKINLSKFISWRMWSKDKGGHLKNNWKGWREKNYKNFLGNLVVGSSKGAAYNRSQQCSAKDT